MATFDSVRIHAIILTRNRTEVLKRSVDTAIMKMGRFDVLTVLDDSTAGVTAENATLLAAVAPKSCAMVTHLSSARLYETAAEETRGSALDWHFRTAARDIAPLRNLALLLSAAVGARTTVFIDDDIRDFDLELTHSHLEHLATGSKGLIVGAEISGQSEMDTLTRLHEAIQRLESGRINCRRSLDELFSIAGSTHRTRNVSCGWVSAGYMAFSIPPTQLFAFPPGYNEDWLWCLMHVISGDVRVVRSGHAVQHAPPAVRRPTRIDVLFELAGDFIWDCLCNYRHTQQRTPLSTLHALARHRPTIEVLPTTRMVEVMELARRPTSGPRLTSCLNDYGLRAVEALMHSGDLSSSEGTILPDWCSDAIAKHESYSTLPANEGMQRLMATMTIQGRK